MEEFDLCKNVKEVLNIDELESKTLEYRLNGFLYACNMDLSDGKFIKSVNCDEYNLGYLESNGVNQYNFQVIKINYPYGVCDHVFQMAGTYNDLEIDFVNQYGHDIMRNKILEIPFFIEVSKNNWEYILKIKKMDDKSDRVEFYLKGISKGVPKVIRFYANIYSFSKILKLVKSFVDNPELVFSKYNEVNEAKKIVFTNTDVEKGYENDPNLDKPASKLVKKIKILTNND